VQEKISDFCYVVRNLCEALRERNDLLDRDDEIKELLNELKNA